MLQDIKPSDENIDPTIREILGMIWNSPKVGTGAETLAPGVYQIGHFSFEHYISKPFNRYPELTGRDGEYFGPYGVCDDYAQILDKCPMLAEDPVRKFVVSVTKVSKASQPAEGGWRWHKWGEYIGTKNPQHEYIHDEDDSIQEVYCYHVYELGVTEKW